MLLSLSGLTVRRGGCPVVDDVSLTVASGEFVGLVGPNGAGKTTLLRAALGLLPHEGRSTLAALQPDARARSAAWLPQKAEIAWPLKVVDLVGLGRLPHGGARGDDPAVARALDRMEIREFRDRSATALSGGEQARVLIARALAQETPLILADEPTAGLDPAAQISAMAVFASLATEGNAVVAALHDLGLAARHCSRLLVMSRGRLVADGRPEVVLTADLLADVFNLRARLEMTDDGLVFQALSRVEAA